MRICIAGGALQGMEAVYLAKKAGYETMVIDKRADAPALALCDIPIVTDPAANAKDAVRYVTDCDAVLPACENIALLAALEKMMRNTDIPFLFDLDSYQTTSSKNISNDLMSSIGIPIPAEWPACGFPAVVKPSSQSGSAGVRVVKNKEEADAAFAMIKDMGDEATAQGFVQGKNVSIEVIGNGPSSRSFVTTEIVLDFGYDCKRVICAPDILDPSKEKEFGEIGRIIGEGMKLNALMDVEAVDTADGLKVLEIDARIPSQTPAAVLAATGVNLLKELVNSKFGVTFDTAARAGVSSYEHFAVKDGILRTCGEKVFSHVRDPKMTKGLFGADEMITDFDNGGEWRAVMINGGSTHEETESKRKECIRRIMDECGISKFIDSVPEAVL